jgi:hypothetical protein
MLTAASFGLYSHKIKQQTFIDEAIYSTCSACLNLEQLTLTIPAENRDSVQNMILMLLTIRVQKFCSSNM